ncbi:MAG: hypothetical protein ACM3JI_01790, partial [Anaerolineae bacterium]
MPSKEVLKATSRLVSNEGLGQITVKSSRNRFIPDVNATGTRSVFRRDPITGRVTHYETYRPQINPYDPKLWESVKRFDGNLHHPHQHYNKTTKRDIATPHIHDPFASGGIRIPKSWEIP